MTTPYHHVMVSCSLRKHIWYLADKGCEDTMDLFCGYRFQKHMDFGRLDCLYDTACSVF